jgi:hypothetical protein
MAQVFRLTKAVTGITFSPEGRGSLSSLPVGAQLRLIGQTRSGFTDVMYCDKPYRIFRVDLMARSVTLRTMAAAASYDTGGTFGSGPLGDPAMTLA